MPGTHIVSLRLLCDTARRKKFKLFVTFIDFSQAYDRVPRIVLFKVLLRLGCGGAMLCALAAMYCVRDGELDRNIVSPHFYRRKTRFTNIVSPIHYLCQRFHRFPGGLMSSFSTISLATFPTGPFTMS